MKKYGAVTLAICALIYALIYFSSSANQGAREGLRLCENIIIPSLLPILILTGIIIKSDCSKIFELLFGKFALAVLRLPECAAAAIVLGLIGGYPTGAVLTRELYLSKKISSDEAKRIMRFNFCGGCSFIITAVGAVRYNNIKTGVLLYIINIFSSLLIAVIGARFAEKPTVSEQNNIRTEFSNAVIESVEISIKSILTMSAYIILFSSLAGMIDIPEFLTPVLEITNGIINTDKALPLHYCAMFLSFGGICIHMQLMGILGDMKIKYTDFLMFRIISALISFFTTAVVLQLFPQSEGVFSNLSSTAPRLNQVNTGLSIIMILGCAVFILDIERRKISFSQAT